MELKPTIHVIDDDTATRSTLTSLFGSVQMQVRCYRSAEAFLDDHRPRLPGCIVLETRLPGMSGLELQATLTRYRDGLPLVFVSGCEDVPTAVQAMRAGAVDFLVKPVRGGRVLESVQEAVTRDRESRRKIARETTVQARLALLTRRERQVLERVAAGRSNKEIGRDLGISHKTVELHRSSMMNKLHADSIVQLVELRLSAGLPVAGTDGADGERAPDGLPPWRGDPLPPLHPARPGSGNGAGPERGSGPPPNPAGDVDP